SPRAKCASPSSNRTAWGKFPEVSSVAARPPNTQDRMIVITVAKSRRRCERCVFIMIFAFLISGGQVRGCQSKHSSVWKVSYGGHGSPSIFHWLLTSRKRIGVG